MGNQEWIEISNMGEEDFNDVVHLSGMGKEQKFPLHLPAHASLVLTKA